MIEIDTKNIYKISNEDFIKAIDEIKNKNKGTNEPIGFRIDK
jgi:hypothetical protein